MRHGTHVMDVATAELESALCSGPFHVALRAAIQARGLSLQRVQHHLARRGVNVGVTSLSYWQQGARRPQRDESLRAVRALEEILRLPEESLIRLLANAPPSPRPRPDSEVSAPPQRSATRSYRALMAASGSLERLLAELGAPQDSALRTVGHHERVRIGARRELLARDSQQVVRAHAPGADRYVAVHHGDPGCDPQRMSVHALENCRTGRVRRCPETGVLAAELLFDTRLQPGETHVFRYAFEDGTAGVSCEYARGFGRAGGQYVLQVSFADGVLPVRCHRFGQRSATASRSGRRELLLSPQHRSVHLVDTEVREGLLGIGWAWEQER